MLRMEVGRTGAGHPQGSAVSVAGAGWVWGGTVLIGNWDLILLEVEGDAALSNTHKETNH